MRNLVKMENQHQEQKDESPRPAKRSIAEVVEGTPTSTVEASVKQYMLQYIDDSAHTSTDDSGTLSGEETDDEDDDDDDGIDDEAETAVAKALVRAAMRRTLSVPSLMKLIGSSSTGQCGQQEGGPALKRARLVQHVHVFGAKPPSKSNLCRQKSASVPSLLKLSPQRRPSQNNSNTLFDIKPEEFLKSLLMYKGVEFKTFAALELGNKFFVPVTPEAVAGYDMEVVQDIRNGDIEALRAKKNAGRLLQVCNKFGESVVHTVARRGGSSSSSSSTSSSSESSLRVLKFLMEEAQVSCQVCCDCGRTPLADACWTSSPNFEVIGYLLDQCPDLLYITDSRGFSPLAYAPREHYGAWCQFLKERSLDGLLPRQLM
jgi:hypothetical protein